MIFLSHNGKDKDVVEPIAVRLKDVYGEENIFYDSWPIRLCKIKKTEKYRLEISIEAIKLIEPNTGFGFTFSNFLYDIEINVTSDGMTYNSEGTCNFGNIKCSRITRVLTPGFPYEAVITSKSEILDFKVWHQVSKDRIKPINILSK